MRHGLALLLVTVCALAQARPVTLAWDDPGWPVGTTVEVEANGVSASGITGTQHTLDVPLAPGDALDARARAVSDGYTPSEWATLTATLPRDPVAVWITRHAGGVTVADPVFQGLSTDLNTGSSSVSSQTVTFTTVNAGELVLAFVQRDYQADCTGVTLGGSQALTLLKRHASGHAGFCVDVWGVIASQNYSNVNVVAAYSGTARQWGSMVAARWSDVDSATPTQSSCGAATCSGVVSSSTTRTAQSITTSARNLLVGAGTDWNDPHTHTGANSFTKRFDNAVAGGGSSSLQFIYDRVADAGTYGGSSNFGTAASDEYLSTLLAFEPTSSGTEVGLTGSSSTSSAGSLAKSRDKALSGQSATASAGTLTEAREQALTGQAASASAGTITETREQALTGSAVAASAGTLTETREQALTGQAATASAGTLSAEAGQIVEAALTGSSATASAGSLLETRDKALAGQSVTASAGSLLETRDKALTGSAATTSAGTLTESREQALTGQAVTAASGDLTEARAQTLAGQAVTTAAGTLSAEAGQGGEQALSGSASTASVGSVAPAPAHALAGSSAAASAGTLTATRERALTGDAGSALVGEESPETARALSGQSAAAQAGSMTAIAGSSVTRALVGQAVTFAPGTLGVTRTAAATGAAATTAPGTAVATIPRALTGQSATAGHGALGIACSGALGGEGVFAEAGTLTAPVQGPVERTLGGTEVLFSIGSLGVLNEGSIELPPSSRPGIWNRLPQASTGAWGALCRDPNNEPQQLDDTSVACLATACLAVACKESVVSSKTWALVDQVGSGTWGDLCRDPNNEPQQLDDTSVACLATACLAVAGRGLTLDDNTTQCPEI